MVTSSERRLAANRRNAARSTGPRTPEGKAVVALNALKHGLLSREALVRGESEAELVAFAKRMRAQLAPVGELELLLADRVVSSAWRLRRAVAPARLRPHLGAPETPEVGRGGAGGVQEGFADLVAAALPEHARGRPIEVWFQDEARVGRQGTLT